MRQRQKSEPQRASRYSARNQTGLYLVEFTLVSGVFFLILFGAIEVARLMFTWSALDAVTQRAARVAAVCPMNDAAIGQVAIFGETDGGSSLIPGFTSANVNISYLDSAGAVTGSLADVGFVQASIQNYTHQMLIPSTVADFVAPLLTAPPFTTIRPAESLGRHPGGTSFC